MNFKNRTIFCGDNLDVLRGMDSNIIDLIYLDPPFNKKKQFIAPIGSEAEGATFDDIWREEDTKQAWVDSIEEQYPTIFKFFEGVELIGHKSNKNYLLYMAVRLLEMKRILKDTGSIYLHCDTTMSHYLKLLMDCIFGEKNFRNDIIWHYRRWTNAQKQYQRMHDIILFYTKTSVNVFNFTETKMSESQQKKFERGWDSNVIHTSKGKYSQLIVYDKEKYELAVTEGRVDVSKYKNIIFRERPMVATSDVIIMPAVNSQANEHTGYPTQKPLKLLEILIKASSNQGDIVLDPFCGCATTCVAAERLGRTLGGHRC